ncbi:MAG: hypothetical protein ACODAB_05890, partial [Gemmatimonadota bacterium]
MSRIRSRSLATSVVWQVIVLPFVVLGAGCSDGAAPPAVTVVDSAGVEIVTSRGTGWTAEDAWSLELDLEVGDTEGPNAFGRLIDVVPRRAGGFWVVDAQERRVRGYDDAGVEVLAFGRPGEGPGEFRSVGRLGERPDGGISVGGRMPVELYRFDASGAPLGAERLSPESYRELRSVDASNPRPPGPSLGEWGFADDGTAFVQAMTIDAPVDDIVRSDVILRPADGGRPAVRFASWEAPAMRGGPGGEVPMLQPEASWSPLSGGGLWLSRGEAYELRRYDAAGALRAVLRRPTSRLPVTAEIRTAFLASFEGETDNPGTLAALERAVFPDSLPATVGLWASEADGSLWVGVLDPELPWRVEGPNALDVFDPAGAYVGRLAIPERLRPTRITSEHVY